METQQGPVTRIDLHVHSCHSKHPGEWFLQRIGTQESYTSVDDVYRMAKQNGMTHVTLTDHNTIDGALELRRKHPDDTFISSEITTYFPENKCKVHVLVYNITPEQFNMIQKVRENIYLLRDLLRAQNICCSVAHATFSVNGRLNVELLEKLILLFDVFEAINGTRGSLCNQEWTSILRALTPGLIGRLSSKYGIEPWGRSSWLKGFTGGSDDHAGLFIGKTYTAADGETVGDLIGAIKAGKSLPGGRHGDHKSLAFIIYKIAYEFSKDKSASQNTLWHTINSLMFEEGSLGLRNWIAVRKMKRKKGTQEEILARFFEDLIERRSPDLLESSETVDGLYDSLATLADDYFTMIAGSLERDLGRGDAGRLLRNFSAMLPAVFMAAPFFSAVRIQHANRSLGRELIRALGMNNGREYKRILWFSDTVVELNGVAVTMCELAKCANELDRPMKLVTSLGEDEQQDRLPPNTINLPCIYSMVPEFYSAVTLRMPSLLRSLDIIEREAPDEIVVSTPGPVGLVGLLAAKLMNVRCTGVYHTDFARQADHFIGDEWVSSMTEAYTRKFFQFMDEVRVPTRQYIGMLEQRGLDPARMKLFRRALGQSFADVASDVTERIAHDIGLKDGMTLIWAGRLGKEKNLDVLMDIYEEVVAQRADVNLLIVGDGPEREALQARARGRKRVIFTGRVDRADLAHYYHMADAMVFPSNTDTFGMVVLEAQACGLPALVSDIGGPQEIITDGVTGFVASTQNMDAWVERIICLVDLKASEPDEYGNLRNKIRERCSTDNGWERVLDEIMSPPRPPERVVEAGRPGNGFNASIWAAPSSLPLPGPLPADRSTSPGRIRRRQLEMV